MNAYEMLLEIRSNVNEASEDHWTDLELLRKMNIVQRSIAQWVAMNAGEWLSGKATIAITNSVAYLDLNVAKVFYIEHSSDHYEIPLTNVRDHLATKKSGIGSLYDSPDAYMLGNYLYINQDSFNDSVDIYYENRVPDLFVGAAGAASGASALELEQAMYPKLIDDYYNYVNVEIYNASGYIRSTITDYVAATRICTISGTPASADNYGSESVLPTEAMGVIIAKATTMALSKPSSAIDPKYYQMFKDEYRELWDTFKAWISERSPASMHVRQTEAE